MKVELLRQRGSATRARWKRTAAGCLRQLMLHDESGSALAEMAFVVIPLMMLLITGMVWFGIAMNNDLALNNAVQAGSEQLVLLRGNVADPCAATATDVGNAAPGLTASSLTFTITLGGTAYTGTGITGTGAPTCNGITMTSGETATLTVTYPVTVNLYSFGAHTYTLSSATTALIQ
jgi:Flp pilus assembly protein TadG